MELDLLATEVAGCVRCQSLASTRTQTVFGVGRLDPELCFVGELPGEQEDRQGEPFVGPAGQLLDRIIAACGMKREEVYILNILRCRPPGNRQPTAEEAGNCRGFLERQLEIVRPQYLCALGATAAKHLLGSSLSIGKLRGRFHDFKGMPVICTYHPSYLLLARAGKDQHETRGVERHQEVARPDGTRGSRDLSAESLRRRPTVLPTSSRPAGISRRAARWPRSCRV